jgi:hypothetical protein
VSLISASLAFSINDINKELQHFRKIVANPVNKRINSERMGKAIRKLRLRSHIFDRI